MGEEAGRRARLWVRLPDALPPLQGWVRAAFLVVWSALLTVALVGSVMAAREFLHGESQAANLAGISLYAVGPEVVLGPPIGEEAQAKGIRRGDRLLRIDGAPAPTRWPLFLAALSGPEGSTVTLDTVGPDGEPATHVLTRSPVHLQQSLHAAGLSPLAFALLSDWTLLLLGGVLVIVCAVLLMVRRFRESLAPWASLMLLLGACSNSPAGDWIGEQGSFGFTFTQLANAAYLALLVATLAVFPEGQFRPRWSWLVAVFGGGAMTLTWSWDMLSTNMLFIVCVGLSVLLIRSRYRTMAAGPARQQIRWVLMAFGSSLIALAALITFQALKHRVDAHPAWIWMRIGEFWSWSLGIAIVALGMTISLLRYRLYDADAAISRSAAYGALTLLLIAVFAATQKLIEGAGELYFGETVGGLAGALAAGVAAAVIGPLKRWSAHWAAQRFERRLVDLQHDLPLLVADLRETSSPQVIAKIALTRTVDVLRATRGALIFQDHVLAIEGAAPDDVALVKRLLPAQESPLLIVDRAGGPFPVWLRLRADGVGDGGWLLLGPRPDDSLIGRDEREALAEIGDPLTRALLVATERQASIEAVEARFTAIERRLGQLGISLAS